MKRFASLLLLLLTCGLAGAEELRLSAKESVVVVMPDQWTAKTSRPPSGTFPFETRSVTPPGTRNASCLISIMGKDKPDFADAQFLKKVLRGDSRPYVGSPDELPKLQLKELKINGGLGFYANFVDPDLVGKPVKKGTYKTATPIILSLGSKYLIKITVLCDEIDGADYREAIKLVESIRLKTNEA